MASVNESFVRYNKTISDDYTIMINAQKGLSPKVFDDIINISGLGRAFLAEQVFDMSLKTIMRYQKENKKFSPRSSEVALKLLSLLKRGIDILGSNTALRSWLHKPAYGLGNESPINLLNTITGIDLVQEELIRIEYGALA